LKPREVARDILGALSFGWLGVFFGWLLWRTGATGDARPQ